MAMYHFRIKTDKKPDGTKISAFQHVEYIQREGKYDAPEKFVGNFISTAEMENADEGLLYKTDEFGSIRNTANGIEITEKASLPTTAIWLMLVAEKMKHQPLVVSGNADFLQSVLEATVKFNLDVKFANERIENEVRRRKEKQADKKEDEQVNLIRQTVEEILSKVKEKSVNAETHVEYISREKAFAKRGGCIFHSHHLPKWAKDDPKKFFKAADKYEGATCSVMKSYCA